MNRISFFALFISSAIIGQVSGQNDTVSAKKPSQGDPADKFAMFESESMLEASISFDLGAYLKKNLKGEALDGKMTINLNATDQVENEIKIKHRGIFRQDYCGFPPMEINFKKPVSAYKDGDGFKKVKLVTHCEQGKGSDDYVLREYLVYKMFNILTDTSYRVRLFRINYIDSKSNKKTITQYGFCIEPADVLAKRINCMRLKNASLTQKQVIPDIITRISLFNYMIGNYDWAVPNQHNIHIYKSLDVSKGLLAVAVPYDYDFTGFVNPYYAIPTDETGLKTIRERLFTGICRTREEFAKELGKIHAVKNELLGVINDFQYMDPRSKKDLTGYLEQFFSQMDSKNDLERLIDTLMMSCKKL